MLQGQGMVLKGRVQVGLGRMPRVPRLGEEAKVGQAVLPHHRGLLLEQSTPLAERRPRMYEQDRQGACESGDDGKEER